MVSSTSQERFLAFDVETPNRYNNRMSAIGISVDVTLVEPESLPRSEGKAIRVIDDRNFD